MKYILRIYIDGKLKSESVKTNDHDWNWLDKRLEKIHAKYTDNGYKNIQECISKDYGYVVFFNDEIMKSAVVSYSGKQILDFNDSNKIPIIEGKTYRGILQGEKFDHDHDHDRYQIRVGWNNELYIRNLTRCEGHIVNTHGFCRMSTTVGDKYDFDQNYIDALKLEAL